MLPAGRDAETEVARLEQLMPAAHSPSRTDAGPAGPASGGHGAVLRQETGRSGGRRMPSAAMTAQGSSGSSVATARRSIPTATSNASPPRPPAPPLPRRHGNRASGKAAEQRSSAA